MKIQNIDKFKDEALKRLQEVKEGIESGETIAFAIAEVTQKTSKNMWIVQARPVTLIGEMHCLMADMEYYEVDLRKNVNWFGGD